MKCISYSNDLIRQTVFYRFASFLCVLVAGNEAPTENYPKDCNFNIIFKGVLIHRIAVDLFVEQFVLCSLEKRDQNGRAASDLHLSYFGAICCESLIFLRAFRAFLLFCGVSLEWKRHRRWCLDTMTAEKMLKSTVCASSKPSPF